MAQSSAAKEGKTQDAADALALGLSAQEYQRICALLKRTPNAVERAIFAAMWSEHCSYKSSRAHLARLPSRAPHVIYGPGENAGAVDIGGGLAAVFKIESHNHPSFIAPYQGAATGVGGILRDVFCMGARPIALLNALRFGAPDHPKTRALLAGAVAGIGDYGNCVGVPTVGGELGFDARYNGNILVNAMCVGLAKRDRIFTARPRSQGHAVVYVGAKTGRDGIQGATMASAAFSSEPQAAQQLPESDDKRSSVQIGDPFCEKLLLEACLALLEEDAVEALQDMGAAGLTSSAVEMASKGGLGIELELAHVPCRARDMQPAEILLSESQERMLMIIAPKKLPQARAIFAHWGLAHAAIGRLTADKHFCVRHHGTQVARLPVDALGSGAPLYRRPHRAPPKPARLRIRPIKQPLTQSLHKLLGSLPLASRRWVWEQYDSSVMGDTLAGSGGDAALVRVHGTQKALAFSCDSTPRYCAADARIGGRQALAENWRNLTAVGATPLAWTNCLNFGNPERAEIMGAFRLCLEGMRDAALALDYPVVSGNVSFYNETDGQGICPTPVIGGVGLVPQLSVHAQCRLGADEAVYLLGAARGELGCSLYAELIADSPAAAPPPVDLAQEKRLGDFVRTQIRRHGLRHVHDVSDGGALTALAEMALASGIGFDGTDFKPPIDAAAFWFGEDQARYLVSVPRAQEDRLRAACAKAKIPHIRLGATGTDALTLGKNDSISIADLRAAHERALPDYMAG